MQVYPSDYIVEVKLTNDVMPSMMHHLQPGVHPWQLRAQWQDKTIWLINNELPGLLRAMATLGQYGAIINGVSVERGSVWLERRAI